MRLQSVLLFAGLSAVSISAEPVAVQARDDTPTDAQISKFVDDILSFATSLANNPTYTSVLMALETDEPAIFSSINNYQATAVQDPSDITAAPAFLTVVPTQYRPIFSSIWDAEVSIAIKDGIVPTPTGSSGGGSSAGADSKPNAGNMRSENSVVAVAGGVLAERSLGEVTPGGFITSSRTARIGANRFRFAPERTSARNRCRNLVRLWKRTETVEKRKELAFLLIKAIEEEDEVWKSMSLYISWKQRRE
ncbi:hypothetical protein F5884DRAFT_860387 [Xylogone sp. PMI_703]|nr:hypothetical protein F5884DRAFT_860387 [Xylogone sp. PMI_703]